METTESKEYKVCKTTDIPSGEALGFQVDDKEIGVFNIKGKFYAMENLCIHAGAPLHDSPIDESNCQVTCGWHAWTFDIATGKCVSHARQDVFQPTYSVRVDGDDVYVKVEKAE